jgi:hypothetical protein
MRNTDEEARMTTPARRDHDDLLSRPPSGVGDLGRRWTGLVPDPVAQLEELADLVDRGLLSRLEYEELKARVVCS